MAQGVHKNVNIFTVYSNSIRHLSLYQYLTMKWLCRNRNCNTSNVENTPGTPLQLIKHGAVLCCKKCLKEWYYCQACHKNKANRILHNKRSFQQNHVDSNHYKSTRTGTAVKRSRDKTTGHYKLLDRRSKRNTLQATTSGKRTNMFVQRLWNTKSLSSSVSNDMFLSLEEQLECITTPNIAKGDNGCCQWTINLKMLDTLIKIVTGNNTKLFDLLNSADFPVGPFLKHSNIHVYGSSVSDGYTGDVHDDPKPGVLLVLVGNKELLFRHCSNLKATSCIKESDCDRTYTFNQESNRLSNRVSGATTRTFSVAPHLPNPPIQLPLQWSCINLAAGDAVFLPARHLHQLITSPGCLSISLSFEKKKN